MKLVIAAAVAALTVAAPAQAATLSGPYVGAGVTVDNIQGSGPIEGLGASGVGATLFAGYNYPVTESVFVGVEANADLQSADVPLGGTELQAKWNLGASVRAGVSINDSTAVYTRVGYARQRLSLQGVGGQWLEGVRYGAGVETALNEQISLRAEFTQTNLNHHFINNQGVVGLIHKF